MSEQVSSEFMNNMKKQFVVKNIGAGKVTLIADENAKSAPHIELGPKGEVVLTAFQMANVYSNSVTKYVNGKKKLLSLSEVGETKKSVAMAPMSVAPKADEDQQPMDKLDDMVDDESPEADVREPAVIQKEIKALEKEYKMSETSLDRKQEIKVEVAAKKKELKVAKKK